MKKFSRLKSFNDFKANNISENVTVSNTTKKTKEVSEHKSIITRQRKSLSKLNEAAFKVGEDYKVKITIDVPVSLVKSYIEKVSNETGKNALDNFSETEIAEQMVYHTLKHNLNLDSIPASLTVGDSATQEVTPEQQIDAAMVGAEFDSEQELEIDDIEDAILDSEEVEIDSDFSDDTQDTEGEEIELDDKFGNEKESGEELEFDDDTEENMGEVRSVENDTETSDDDFNFNDAEAETEETETEEEEEHFLDDTVNSVNISDMSAQLRASGLDPRDFSDEQIVDIWNDIFSERDEPINGIDDTGSIIIPSMF